jgi:hypothetical protein
VKTLKQNKIFQSIFREATCADNAAMENFFGLLKQEMYYGEEVMSYEALQKKMEEDIYYYNNDRIKQKLAGMSPKIPNSCQPISSINKTLTLRGHFISMVYFYVQNLNFISDMHCEMLHLN